MRRWTIGGALPPFTKAASRELVVALVLGRFPVRVARAGAGGGTSSYWELADRLGTGMVMLDETGARLVHRTYTPFGMEHASAGTAVRPATARIRRRDVLAVVLVAVTLTGLNAFKPLVIDDDTYYQYARQIVDDPTDPYGFELVWFNRMQHANEILAPPVLPYYLAVSLAIFGEQPLAWKLSLLPFALLLSASLWRLLSLFAPRGRIPLLCLALLSPTILPAFNLMLDIPMLAIALTALAMLLRAADDTKRGMALAAAAGLVGGIAMLTKYNAVLPFAAGLLYLALSGHWRRAVMAGATAALPFLCWEAFVISSYGSSHFLNAVSLVNRFSRGTPTQWIFCFLSVVGAGLPALALLGLGVLRAPLLLLVLVAGGIVFVLAAIAWSPAASLGSLGTFYPVWRSLRPIDWLLPITGLVSLLAVGAALGREAIRPLLLQCRRAGAAAVLAARSDRRAVLLLSWLAIELAGFFVLSPFPALRRVIGLNVAIVCALGCVAERAAAAPGQARLRGLAVFGVALGLLFAVTDLRDAVTRRRGVDQLVARLAELPSSGPAPTAWFVGRWGFRYYAGRAGLQPAIPGESTLRAGDWLVVPRAHPRQGLRAFLGRLELVDVVAVSSAWPWSTLPGAYGGYRSIRRQPVNQMQLMIHRVVGDD